MGPGSHVILMLLRARTETKKLTKYMVRVHADGAEQCFLSFGSDTVSTWMFREDNEMIISVADLFVEV